MVWRYVILLAVGVVMVYPLVWMIGASFMTNEQIFSSGSYGKKYFWNYKLISVHHEMKECHSLVSFKAFFVTT